LAIAKEPSRRHNAKDTKFIAKKAEDLLEAGVIEEAIVFLDEVNF